MYKKTKFIFNNCIFSDVMDSDEGEVAKPSTSSRKGPPPRKKTKPLTPAEKTRKCRAAMSGEKKNEEKAKNKQRMATQRGNQSEEKKRKENSKDQHRMATKI